MKHRRLGKSDLQVSVVGLGCNNFGYVADMDAAGTRKVVDRAIDCGVNFFDTSDSYGKSEELLGEVLGARRHKIVLATKFGSQIDIGGGKKKGGAARAYIVSEVEESLRRLRTDFIDLYQLHRPDPHTHIEETLRALDDLVKQGKVRYIGCSNLSAPQLKEAEEIATKHHLHHFVCSQDEYSLLVRDIERDLLPTIELNGMSELPYFPLASGMLTGKYKGHKTAPAGTRLANKPGLAEKYASEHNHKKVDTLHEFATSRGHTLLELAFGFLLSHHAVASVIAGATRPEQIEANSQAAGWELSPEDLAEVNRITGSS